MGLGLALKFYRIRAGIRQKELARRVGASASYLSLVEAEKKAASLDFLSRAATALGVPLELFIIDAKEQEGKLTPEQSDLFSRAKNLVWMAARLEHEKTSSKTGKREMASQHSKSGSSSTPSRRAQTSPRSTRKARRVALQSHQAPSEKARRQAKRD